MAVGDSPPTMEENTACTCGSQNHFRRATAQKKNLPSNWTRNFSLICTLNSRLIQIFSLRPDHYYCYSYFFTEESSEWAIGHSRLWKKSRTIQYVCEKSGTHALAFQTLSRGTERIRRIDRRRKPARKKEWGKNIKLTRNKELKCLAITRA